MKPFKGKIISTKMKKTAVVVVKRRKIDPLYKKAVKRTKKYHVDNQLKAKVGDQVEFVQTRPISKTKKWKVVKIIK